MRARRHRLLLSAFATALVASLAITAPSAHAANCAGADQLPVLSSLAGAKAATLCLLNDQRVAQGLAPLTSEPTLEAAATSYAQSMVQQQFFSHVSPSGGTIDDRLASYIAGTSTHKVGENLAWGSGVLATPRAVVNGWMRSQGHRDNILMADFSEIGVGVVAGSPAGGLLNVGVTYATDFGSRNAEGAPAPTRASAAAVSVNVTPPGAAKTLSAKAKRRISEQCRSAARRMNASSKTRRARYDRCVRTKTKAARGTAG